NAGDSADAVVVIGGSAKIRGNVRDAVVVIGGDADVQGEVRDAVVAVLGNVKVGQEAKVHDVAAIGGKLDIADGAAVDGHTQEVDLGAFGFDVDWLKQWFLHCALKLRPLADRKSTRLNSSHVAISYA